MGTPIHKFKTCFFYLFSHGIILMQLTQNIRNRSNSVLTSKVVQRCTQSQNEFELASVPKRSETTNFSRECSTCRQIRSLQLSRVYSINAREGSLIGFTTGEIKEKKRRTVAAACEQRCAECQPHFYIVHHRAYRRVAPRHTLQGRSWLLEQFGFGKFFRSVLVERIIGLYNSALLKNYFNVPVESRC